MKSTDAIFKKAIIFSDAHIGKFSNSSVFSQDVYDFFLWAVDRGQSWGAETCIFCGDLFDNRNNVGVQTLDYALRCLELLSKSFKTTYVLMGNHDCMYRDKRDISSITFARHLPNIVIVDSHLTLGDVTFLPWLVGDEPKMLKNIKSRYVFGHLELPGFYMNSKVILPDSDHLAKADQFDYSEYVFTGHFHQRQSLKIKNTIVSFIGNVFPFDFSDDWDSERGAMLLEWGKEPIFEAWSEQPLFRTMKLTEMLENPRYLLPKMTIKASVDLTLMYEEAQEIKEELMKQYGLRKIELVHMAQTSVEEQTFTNSAIVFQSVDQIVEEGLRSVESVGLSQDRLVDIYRSLPR